MHAGTGSYIGLISFRIPMLSLNYDVTLRSMELCSNNRRGLLGQWAASFICWPQDTSKSL